MSIRLRRSILRSIFRLIFRVLCRIELRGVENIPKEGGYVIAHNHISLFEPPLVLAFWPVAPEGIAGADVFHRPGQKILVRAYHAIPVHRDEYDRKVVDTMMQVLAAGKPLMISPEGGRSHVHALREARVGVAYLVDRAKVPVVPVGIIGTTDDMLSRALRGQRPHIEMRIGEPFLPPPIEGRGDERRKARRRNADMIMKRIAALLPEDYRGVYS